MRRLALIVAVMLLVLSINSALAADRWGIEVRGGVATPTQDLGDTKLDLGFGLEGKVSYRVQPHLHLFAGWDWHNFGEDTENEAAGDIEETGYAFGAEFIHPLGESSLAYQVRAGITLNHIEFENHDGDIVADTDHGLGWEIGAGIRYNVAPRWHLSPGLRYRSLSQDLDMGDASVNVDLSYLAFEIGFVRTF